MPRRPFLFQEDIVSTQLISAVLIVKNEQEHLPACMAALAGVVDEIVVADTGSTDQTIALAKGFTENIFHVPWTNDFAAARNAAIAHAHCPWILSIDADECVEGGALAGAALRRFIENQDPHTVGTVEIHNVDNGEGVIDETIDHTERLFHREHFQFSGAIHEQLVPLAGDKARARTEVRVVHTGYAQTHADPAHKSRRNIPLILAAIGRKPEDEYLYFQLGKAHYALKEYGPAADAFLAALSRMRFSGATLPEGCQGTVARPVVTGCIANTAYALVNLGRAQEALALLRQHAALGHPATRWADFEHVMGYVYLMLGDVPRARAAYDASLQLGAACEDVVGTGSFASLYHLGLLDEADQKIADATAHYRASLALRPAYKPTISRALDWLVEGHAAEGVRLLAAASSEAAKTACLDRLERSLQNGELAETQRILAAVTLAPGSLHDTAVAWAQKKNL